MTETAAMLDREMLRAYEDRLRAQGLPVDSWARPGLTGTEIEETLTPLGLRAPVEGRVWWEWHDGGAGSGSKKALGPSGDEFLSLSRAVKVYRQFRGIVLELVEPEIPALANPDDRWNPAWFPIMGPQRPIVIDCSVSPGDPTPVRFISLEDVEGSPKPRAQSLGQLVSWWSRAIDSGGWRWDPDQERWLERPELMDREYRMVI